jgi:RES domain-containing protein
LLQAAPPPKPTFTICSRTGLQLAACPDFQSYRVQKTSYGPLKPPERPTIDECDRKAWGRWDVAGHRTIYSAATRVGAYVETLSWAQKKHGPGTEIRLGDFFDDEEDPEATLMKIVDDEFQANNWMPWGQIPADWRRGRALYTLTLPSQGWFVEVEAGETISVLNQRLPKLLTRLSVESLTLEHLYSSPSREDSSKSRELTTSIARWLWGRNLFDGSRPLGIRYNSKFDASDVCYAIWLRAVDDGKTLDDEPTKCVGSQEITETDPDLWQAAGRLGLRIH